MPRSRKKERRRHTRVGFHTEKGVPIDISVCIVNMEERYRTYGGAINLSKGGLFVTHHDPFPRRTKVLVELPIPRVDERLLLRGVVIRRVTAGNSGRRGMGIAFRHLTHEAKGLLSMFIEHEMAKSPAGDNRKRVA